jgi:hypothetical protein
MQISEQNKQEAEKIITTINAILIYNEGVIVTKHFVIECAIQDRQSVLEAFKKSDTHHWNNKLITEYFNQQIQSLTEQIEFLKTKL